MCDVTRIKSKLEKDHSIGLATNWLLILSLDGNVVVANSVQTVSWNVSFFADMNTGIKKSVESVASYFLGNYQI